MVTVMKDFFEEKIDRRNNWIKKKKFKFEKNSLDFKRKNPYKRKKKDFEDDNDE